MQIDARLAAELVTLIALVVGLIQSYRKGNNDALSNLVKMAREQAETNYDLLTDCQGKLSAITDEAAKWKDAFKLRGHLMRKSGVKAGKWTLQYVSKATYAEIHTDYIDQSNS